MGSFVLVRSGALVSACDRWAVRGIRDALVGGGFEFDRAVVGAVAVEEGGSAGEDAEGDEDDDGDHGREPF